MKFFKAAGIERGGARRTVTGYSYNRAAPSLYFKILDELQCKETVRRLMKVCRNSFKCSILLRYQNIRKHPRLADYNLAVLNRKNCSDWASLLTVLSDEQGTSRFCLTSTSSLGLSARSTTILRAVAQTQRQSPGINCERDMIRGRCLR